MGKDLNQRLRPSKWDDVVGQGDIKEIVLSAIKNNTFPSFSIFCGPTGVGKSCMAELTAKTLLCTAENKPCGECQGCVSDSGRSIVKYNMATMIGKKDIVQVLEDIFKYEGVLGKTVYILEEVQVLKQKEEQTPFLEELTKIPEDVYVMMCTTQVTSLLPAMRNRATTFQLTVPTNSECTDMISDVLEKLGIEPMTENARNILASLSNNTPRNIIKHIGLLTDNNKISEVTMHKFFKTISRTEYIKCLGNLANTDVSLQQFVKYLKSLEGDTTFTGLVKGLRDFILTALIEASVGTPDPTLSTEDRKMMIDVMKLMTEKDFLGLVKLIGELKGEKVAEENEAMYELISLKMKVLGMNSVTVVQSNTQNASISKIQSARHSQSFVKTPVGREEVTSDISDELLEIITGNGGLDYTEDDIETLDVKPVKQQENGEKEL